jgi:hypothetical protein
MKQYTVEVNLKTKIKSALLDTPSKIIPKTITGKIAAGAAITGLVAGGHAIQGNRPNNVSNLFKNTSTVVSPEVKK